MHVSLPPTLLAVEPEQLQLSPVVQLFKYWVPDPTNKALLQSLQAVDAALVGGGPPLAEVVQPWLDKKVQ